MPVSPINPPAQRSAQRLVDCMSIPGAINNSSIDDWWAGWNYPAHRYGAVNSIGARLKHNSNLYQECQISPWRELLATLYIQWITTAFKFPRDNNHNVGIELVPMPSYYRIRPDLNSGRIEWGVLATPNGGVEGSYIASSGVSVAYPPASFIIGNGRIRKMPGDWILHPWAVQSNGSILTPITSMVSQDTNNPYADSRVDCITGDWWVRLVPFDESQPLNHDLNANPVLLTAAADPYINFPRMNNGVPMPATACIQPIASSGVIRVTTSWQQVGFMTSVDAPDLHTNQAYSGISNAEFLANPPPGFAQGTVVIPPDPPPVSIVPVPAPSLMRWTAAGSGVNQWEAGATIASAPSSLVSDQDEESEMLIQQSASTGAKRTIIFRAVDATDGYTAETGLTFGSGEIKISKNGAAEANHAGTVTEIAGGMYKYEFALAEVDTVGALSFRTNKSGVRPQAFLHQVVAFDPTSAASLGLSNLDATVSSRLQGTSYTAPTALLTSTDGVETGLTVQGALRLILAAVAGRRTGLTSTAASFKDYPNTKVRVTMTYDASGNTSTATYDPS